MRTQSEGGCLHTQEEPQEELALPAPGSQTTRLQDCEEICFCCESRTACGVLLWQPR